MSTVLQDFFETFLDFLTPFDSMKLFSFQYVYILRPYALYVDPAFSFSFIFS